MPTIPSLDHAFQEYLDGLGSIASCVVSERVVARPSSPQAQGEWQVALASPGAMRARHGGHGAYRMDFRQIVRGVLGDINSGSGRTVDVITYEHRLLDHFERELVVYHWQPGEIGRAAPHMHVSAALAVQVSADLQRNVDLDKRHLVTSMVEFPDFVRMLITEFEVRPLRADWLERLESASR